MYPVTNNGVQMPSGAPAVTGWCILVRLVQSPLLAGPQGKLIIIISPRLDFQRLNCRREIPGYESRCARALVRAYQLRTKYSIKQ